MAKQRGVFKAQGLLDEFSFYESADGFLIRKKGGVNAERIATDPSFERVRENMQEFSRAGRAAKIVRNSVRPLLQYSKDRLLISRLLTTMMKVVKSDPVSERGKRNVIQGDLTLMEGFEFSRTAKMSENFGVQYNVTVDRVGGKLGIEIPAFVPANMITAPLEATHFKIVGAGGSIDFATGINSLSYKEGQDVAIGKDPTTVANLSFDVEVGSTAPLFLILGLTFTQLVNGDQCPLKSKAFNSLQIVKVSVV
jgi:hypothetical protein